MAIFHLSVKNISRGQGRSSVGAAAYRSGERLFNRYDGLTHDFTGKGGIVHTEIILPDDAPEEYLDRETLWNAAEFAEEHSTRKNQARTAREIEIALPNELSFDEQLELVRGFVRDNFVNQGMCADVAMHNAHRHDKDRQHTEAEHDNIITPQNPHAHILLATRKVDRDGFTGKGREWNQTNNVTIWRKAWADAQNREFERKGLDIRVSHESNAKRGLDREPTKHLGHEVTAMERRGIQTERGDENRAIAARNIERDERERRRQQEREQSRERPDRDQKQERGRERDNGRGNQTTQRETGGATPDRTSGTSRDR